MKGPLFPLGQPLRVLEDRPRAGPVPRLQPCLLPVAVGVSWALGLLPTDGFLSSRGQPERRCPHAMVAPPSPERSSPASRYRRA